MTRGAEHVRFNIETKITPTSSAETPDPDTFAMAVATAIRAAGLTERASVQSFDWRTLTALRSIAPEIERVCLTTEAPNFDTIRRGEPVPRPGPPGSTSTTWRFGAAAGRGRGLRHVVAVLPQRQAGRCRSREGTRPQGDTVDREQRTDMERLIDLGVDGLITDYPDRLRAMMAAKEMPLPPAIKMPSR